MLKLVVSASLWWLGVNASYFNTRNVGGCEADGGYAITNEAECKVTAKQALGYRFSAFTLNTANYAPGCSVINGDVYYNTGTGGPKCNGVVWKGGGNHWVTCLCKRSGGGGGADSGDSDGDDDQSCTAVRKKRICKSLSQYCNYNRGCEDKNPSVKIPAKEYCESMNKRGMCRRAETCLWTGTQCLLRSEGSCTDLAKRRRCSWFREGKGNCLNGRHCFMMFGTCRTNTYASC